MAEESKAGDVAIDEDFYSRQLLVLGRAAMERMAKYSVLIVGLTGVGCEVAKNIILAGMQSVTLHDDEAAVLGDLSSHFYLRESDVGRPRAEACVDRLRALNGMVRVNHITGALSEDVVRGFDMVVCVDQSRATLERIGAICTTHRLHMLATGTYGLLGYTFTCLGPEHVIIDANGEDPATGVAVSISNANPGVVELAEGDVHGLCDGDTVVFERVEGMTELNGGKGRPVKVVTARSFTIEDTTGYGKYLRGGYFKQIKQPVTESYKPFTESLAEPEFVMDYMNLSRPSNIHAVLLAVWGFEAANGRPPAPGSASDAAEIFNAACKLVGDDGFGDDEAKAMRILAGAAPGRINPMAAVFGGITAQEVIKAASGKFTPIKQWFMLDAASSIEATPSDCEPRGTRYDGQIAVFGQAFQDALLELKYFLVGSGALGCEFLKNFALMGIGCGESGFVYLTDMDNIEKSNLNRQFLFHEDDVGQMKSTAAAREAKTFNPRLNITAATDKMAPETEGKYNDKFWMQLDGVCNALDNLDARLYIDSRCVNFNKPLLESGTLGTMGNNLTCIPGVTLNYGAGPRPTEHKFPVCVVHGFPYNIQHCLHWAKEHFDNLFKDRPTEVNTYMTTPDFLEYLKKQKGSRMQRLQILSEMLAESKRPRDFADCVRFARLQFQDWFNVAIKNLLHQHPLDEEADGVPYWSQKKRPPTPEEFSLEDELHASFIVSSACLYARLFSIPESSDLSDYAAALEGFKVPEFDESQATFVPANEEERKKHEAAVAAKAEEDGEDLDTRCQRLTETLPAVAELGSFTCTPINFEKDDPSNKHMDFIYAAANLRARQYNIPESDMMAARKFVGDIIPAIATTTAICTGLVALELAKLVGKRPKEAFCNNNFNLAVNSFQKFEVDECKKVVVGEHEFTLWDKLTAPPDVTVRELVAFFRERYGWVVVGVFSTGADPVSLWAGDEEMDSDEEDEDYDEKVSELYSALKSLESDQACLVVELELGGDLEDVEEVPYVNIPLNLE